MSPIGVFRGCSSMLSPIFLLAACSGLPTPATVAGTYHLYSIRGEVIDWDDYNGAEMFIQLGADGTLHSTSINHIGADTVEYTTTFSVREGEAGCVEVVLGPEVRPEPGPKTDICGDEWTWRKEDGEPGSVYRLRH